MRAGDHGSCAAGSPSGPAPAAAPERKASLWQPRRADWCLHQRAPAERADHAMAVLETPPADKHWLRSVCRTSDTTCRQTPVKVSMTYFRHHLQTNIGYGQYDVLQTPPCRQTLVKVSMTYFRHHLLTNIDKGQYDVFETPPADKHRSRSV